jgi:D-alanyl-D-alanine-carboxypeptidase/D-alanyl-D-alanine-endopeptidase
MNKIEIAGTLIKLRRQKALSQEQLSNQSGVALRTIQRIEAAKVTPHLQTLSLIAAALEVNVDEFTVSDKISIDESKKNWLLLLHLSPIIGSIFPTGSVLVPVAFWLYKRHDDIDYDSHGRSIMNFQISMFLLYCIAIILVFVYTPASIFLLFASIILNFIMVLLNSWRVSKDRPYSYPLALRFFKRQRLPLYSTMIILLVLNVGTALKAQQIKRIDGSVISVDSLTTKL